MASKPTPYDVIKLLESYDIETTKTVSTETVTANHTTNQIIVGGGVLYGDGDSVVLAGADTPAPIVAGSTYYAIVDDTTHVRLALTYENAILGTDIDLSDAGTGTITMSKKDFYFCSVEWMRNRMNNFIIPTIEKWTGLSLLVQSHNMLSIIQDRERH